jgi:nitrate reductase NapE component
MESWRMSSVDSSPDYLTKLRTKAVTCVLWAAAVGITAVLVHRRANPGVFDNIGVDFNVLLHASRTLAAGHSPYAGNPYFVYPPTLALLLAPFSHAAPITIWRIWTDAEFVVLLIGVAAFVASQAPQLPSWVWPILFTFCTVTLFHFNPITLLFFSGNADIFVFTVLLLATLAGRHAHPATRGALIGVAGLLKAWPAAVGLSLLQRGLARRSRAVLAFILAILLAPILAVGFGGRSGFQAFFHNVLFAQNWNTKHLASYSVLSAPEVLFSRSGLVRPLIVSGTLRVLVTAVLLIWVVGLIVVILRTIGDQAMCSWNITFCVVLLVPGSHITYILYSLPVLWLWGARLFITRRLRLLNGVVFGVLFLWWLIEAKTWPDSLSGYCIIFASSLVACTVSAIAAQRVSTEIVEVPASSSLTDIGHQGQSPGEAVQNGDHGTEEDRSPSVVQPGVQG